MSLAQQIDEIPGTAAPNPDVGVLVIESRATTPLGPKIVYANERLSKLTGYEMSSLIGSPLGLIYDRADLSALIEKLPAIASRPNHCFMDRALMRNGGTRRPCRWTIRSTNGEGGRPGFFTLTVKPIVSSQPRRELSPVSKHAPKPELTARNYDESRTESISLAAGGVAHDFKNALQTIKSNLELASLVKPSDPKIQAFITDAQLALGDAEILAHQMLAFTRGEGGTQRVLNLADLLSRVSRLCSAGSGTRCLVSVPPGLRCVEGDPTQIYQVLHNLVINARQSMPSGGTIHVTAGNADLDVVNAYSMPPGRYTVASVRDRGCGIPADILPRIFDPNFTTKLDGSGFGLASCQAIVARHGGGIRVASRVGVGTEFLVFLPSTDASPEPGTTLFPPRESRDSGSCSGPINGTGRVLIVEDQVDVARAARGLLKHLGYDSLHSLNGEDAISVYREYLDTHEPIDVVLLDMTLPGGLTGMDVAKELRRLDPGARIIATSGYFEGGRLEHEFSNYFTGVLPKPYSMLELSEVMESALAG
ncbi:MAG: response regulator [Verrucomicrobiales bacterium]|nr:response regulator [Verrucomicrobiales bacterium]HQW27536.1 ATP-binding protein [Verrucomicrobiales bacterium]